MTSTLRKLVVFHPSPFMVDAVDELISQLAPRDLQTENVVIPDLLARAERGITAEIEDEIRAVVEAVDNGAAPVILCTCSTLGGCAEAIGSQTGRAVIRIDRPMAECAVDAGKTIGVIAAVYSTIQPTRELLLQVADAAAKDIRIKDIVVESAWEKKRAGDSAGYIDDVVAAIRRESGNVDALVLAQGSMAAAADQVPDVSIPVLTSPRLGVARAIAMAQGRVTA